MNTTALRVGILLGIFFSGCVTLPAPDPTPAPALRVFVHVVDEATGRHLTDASVSLGALPAFRLQAGDDRAAFSVPAAQVGASARLVVARPDYQPYAQDVRLSATGSVLDVRVSLRAEFVRRAGVVQLPRRGLVDDDGPFLATGESFFWGLWGYLHDLPKLEANLADLARTRTVDFIRVFGVVGGESWADRAVSGNEPGYQNAISAFTDLAHSKYGLRVQWTIFGGVDFHPTPASREALVRRFMEATQDLCDKIAYFEVTNEAQLSDPAEVQRYGRLLKGTGCLVAPTSPPDLHVDGWYNPEAFDLQTLHLERSTDGTGGMWRPVRQAREGQLFSIPWASGEPIGVRSSVAMDDDPLRLTMAAVYTWLSNGAAYVIHTDAGIRGGGRWDVNPPDNPIPPADVRPWHPRATDFAKSDNFHAIHNGIRTARSLLPTDLPDWRFHTSSRAGGQGHPFNVERLLDESVALRTFAATHEDGRFVVAPIDIRSPLPLEATRAMRFDIHDPLTGAVRASVQLAEGETYWLEPRPRKDSAGRDDGDAVLILGRFN